MLNNVAIMGRLCADPELRQTQSGIPVCSCRIAVDRDYISNGVRETDFFDVVAWRGTAEFICKHFSKGGLVALDGRLQSSTWTDREGGSRVSVEVVAEHIHFAGSRKSAA